MRKFLDKLKRIMLYGGLEKEQYQLISENISEANRKSLVIISAVCAVIYAIRLNFAYAKIPHINRVLFVVAVCVFGIIAVLNKLIRKKSCFVNLSAYLFMIVYLGIGIVSAVGEGSVQERTTLYLVFVYAAPMMFALNAAELTAVVIPAELIYLAAIARFQSAYPVYATNQSNSIFFSLTGLMLGIYMSNMKVSGIYNAYMNSRMEEIKELNEELKESKESLSLALEAAESANRAKTRFLSNMSHDIRTPMNAIIGFTTLAELHIDDKSAVENYLGKISMSGKHLLSLINDVLDMSRIESGKVSIEENPLSLTDLVYNLQTIVQVDAAEKQLEFNVKVNIEHKNIFADKLRLNRLLLNILSNAVKFTNPGGKIDFTVTEKNSLSEEYAGYEFVIKDNGIGMSKEFQEKVFEAFSRESDISNTIQGTGLGMAIAKKITDMMNGSISVKSKEDVGTEFTVDLSFKIDNGEHSAETIAPVTESKESIPDIKALAADFSGKRILLAEDNILNQEIASVILTESGFEVDIVNNGEAAVEKIRNSKNEEYDAVLMDIQMPIMNGYEAARHIRSMEDKERANVPIIAMTANAFDEDRKNAFDAGMNEHIAKPIDINKLMEILGRILSK